MRQMQIIGRGLGFECLDFLVAKALPLSLDTLYEFLRKRQLVSGSFIRLSGNRTKLVLDVQLGRRKGQFPEGGLGEIRVLECELFVPQRLICVINFLDLVAWRST